MRRSNGRGQTPRRRPAEDDNPLEQIRRQRDWSYRQLGDDIERKTGYRRDQDCWRKICLGITHDPQGTTLFILQAYLAKANGGERRRRAS